MRAIGGVDQLCRDANAISGTAHAAFQNRADTECFGNTANVLLFATEGEGGGAGDHFQAGNLRQQVDDLFRESVAEVVLLLVAAHIGEGQHGDGRSGWNKAPGSLLMLSGDL